MIDWKPDKKNPPRHWKYTITDGESVKIRMLVHKHVSTGYDWNLSCDELGISLRTLHSENADEAKEEAARIVYQALREKARLYQRASHIIEWDSDDECRKENED